MAHKQQESKISQYEKRQKRRAIRQLHDAVKKNNISLVQQLLVPDLEIDFHYTGQTALQIAVNNDSPDMCRLLLEHGADVNKYTAEDNSLLHTAAWKGNIAVTRLLVSHGADLDKKNNHNATPLSSASYRGHSEIVKLLVKANSDIDSPNNRGQTPLASTAFLGHFDCAQHLIDGGCDLNWSDNERKSPLIIAAENERVQMVKLLINAGCDIDATDKYRRSALHWAARLGFTDITDLLLKAGASPNITDTKKCSPLLEAVRSQHTEIVRLLTEAGCDVNLAEHETNQAPIHVAVRLAAQYFGAADQQFELVSMLIDVGCDVNATDSAGWTPVYQAAFGGETDVVELLLNQNAHLDGVTDLGNTPLHAAVFGNKPVIMEKLIHAGCDVNKTNNNNELPLYTAISHRSNHKLLELLIRAGSLVDVCEKCSSQSPLFSAIQNENILAVKLLINNGCDVNLPNANYDSPLWVACDKGHEEIVSLLLAHPEVDINAGLSHVPLHAAALHGYNDITDKLIRHGCNVNKLSELGVSALYLAVDMQHLPVIRLLIKHGANPVAPHHMSSQDRVQCCKAYKDPHPHLELEPLYAAVKNDFMEAFHILLVASSPMPYGVLTTLRDIIFRTPYARQARLSAQCLNTYAHVFTTLLSCPRSLKHECRGVIRCSIQTICFEESILSLPVPKSLHSFLLLHNDPVMRGQAA